MLPRWIACLALMSGLLTCAACSPAEDAGGGVPAAKPVSTPAPAPAPFTDPSVAPGPDPATPGTPSTGKPEDAAQPGDLQLERPTLICLGAHWPVKGDANHNARVTCSYRQAGTETWRKALDFFRVDNLGWAGIATGNPKDIAYPQWAPPAGTADFAGSIFELHPGTDYELKIALIDPDGGGAEKILTARTRPVPVEPTGGRTFHVVPVPHGGNAGGDGTAEAPFRGLDEAQSHAQPGDIFLLHKGVYVGTFKISQSGEPGKEIVWKGAGDGETVLDGQGTAPKRPGRTLDGTDSHDLMFENLSIVNADFAVVTHRSSRIVIRHCHIYKTEEAITATVNPKDGPMTDYYIADNLIEGPSTWPRTKGIEDTEGIQIGGEGSVVCYNTIRGFADAISTYQHTHACAIDFYGNEISEQTDDGIEMDYSVRNTRCFRNRLTNCFQGISVQPVYGGPIYIFRNALLNIEVEPFKMHNSPSGALMLHNTVVKQGLPMVVMTPAACDHCVFRNNLFIGTGGNYASDIESPMARCDFDYDGFAGTWENLLKWNNVKYPAVANTLPAERHATVLTAAGCFETKLLPPADVKKQAEINQNDCRLAETSGAIDKGVPLANINDGFGGQAPDLGAYERGQPLPWYGIRKPADNTEESVWTAPPAPPLTTAPAE
ncbi:MAG TPA: hypothetical protein VL860_09135 [Planctomycetota bacterium]|nr:hypothetical protein [Planctomycetota bacterium]